jgi:hypothetical protein
MPHPPQFEGSLLMRTQLLPQRVKPGEQTQVLFWQEALAPQLEPHPPQC